MDNLKHETLSTEERDIFRCLIGIMIPADPKMAPTFADDPLILEACI